MPLAEEDPTLAACSFAGIDFESAGAGRGETDIPIQIGLALLDGTTHAIDGLVRSYLAPDRPIVWSAAEVHGIHPEDLADAPSLPDLWPTLATTFRGRIAVAHGAGTERRFLRAFPMHGFGPWLDTLALSRKTLPDLEDHSLGTCAAALGVIEECQNLCAATPGGDSFSWHDALFDTVACLLVLREIVTALDLWDLPLSALREMGAVRG